jgi:hypothetical protein
MGMVPPGIYQSHDVTAREQRMISQLEYVHIGKNLTIKSNFVYLEGCKKPIGSFDERDNYCSLEPELPRPQYEEMFIPYPENKPI